MRIVSVSLVALVQIADHETLEDAAKRVDGLVDLLATKENNAVLRMLLLRPGAR